MARIAVITPSYTSADAVSNDAAGMVETFQALGHEACLFAIFNHSTRTDIQPLSQLHAYCSLPGTIALYHMSIGSREALGIFLSAPARKLIKYHNITPASFFEPYGDYFPKLVNEGRAELKQLVDAQLAFYLSDSEFNQQELLALGVPREKAAVVPPFHQCDQLALGTRSAPMEKYLASAQVNVLVVGRLAPNKGHRLALETVAYLRQEHTENVRCLIVGKGDLNLTAYEQSLLDQVTRLNLERSTVFLGGTSQDELYTLFRQCHVYLCTSEHEGFCVPLIESMALGLPIVALNRTAVGETVGQAGLVFNEASPAILAEAIMATVNEPDLRQQLIQRGQYRYQQLYTKSAIAQRLTDFMHRFLPGKDQP